MQSADFSEGHDFFHLKYEQCSSNSKYTTYKPVQSILRKLQLFKDIKVRKSDLYWYEHEMVKQDIKYDAKMEAKPQIRRHEERAFCALPVDPGINLCNL